MTGQLARIFRHPVKAIGREELHQVDLMAGKILPWDRAFAVAHAKARDADLDQPWAKKANYLRGVTGPSLMAVEAQFDPETGDLTLTHPDQAPLQVCLTDPSDHPSLVAWLAAIWPSDAPGPTRVVHHASQAQTDVPQPWVAIHALSSHAQVADALGAPDLSLHRWRGNLWLEGTEPWDEWTWVGRDIQIGDCVFHVHQPITRCKATMANPVTGERDLDTLDALNRIWGHQDFGVYASVLKGGLLRPGAELKVL